MTTLDDIDFFFEDSAVHFAQHHRRRDDDRSVLYMLRTDLRDILLGWSEINGRIVTEDEVVQHAHKFRLAFPATMLVFAGIDLLAKFDAGKDDSGGVGSRFRSFVDSYMQSPAQGSTDAIYAVRNTLMHSFGLYDPHGNKKLAIHESCGQEVAPAVREQGGVWFVCVKHLYMAFIEAVRRYEQAVRSDADAQHRFEAMFPKYGYIAVRNRPSGQAPSKPA